jgi:hypothetical protein
MTVEIDERPAVDTPFINIYRFGIDRALADDIGGLGNKHITLQQQQSPTDPGDWTGSIDADFDPHPSGPTEDGRDYFVAVVQSNARHLQYAVTMSNTAAEGADYYMQPYEDNPTTP